MTREIEIQKYEIDKKFELQQQKLESANMIKVGNETLASISLMADKFAKAGDLIPKEFQANPEKCFVAIYKGASLGLDAFTSLQRIAVINGRATIWGDTALALVRKSGLMMKFEEVIIEEKDNMIARCTVQRKGESEHVSEYSQKEAIIAGLWGNNVWKKYPKRMLKYRARAFALRDIFADVLDGLYLKEEIEGGEDFKDVTPETNNSNIDRKRMAALAWGKDDIKNDFPDAPTERPKMVIQTKSYQEIIDLAAECNSVTEFEEFQQEIAKDLFALGKSNKADFANLTIILDSKKKELAKEEERLIAQNEAELLQNNKNQQ